MFTSEAREQLAAALMRDDDSLIPDPYFFDWQGISKSHNNFPSKADIAAEVRSLIGSGKGLNRFRGRVRILGRNYNTHEEIISTSRIRAGRIMYSIADGTFVVPRPTMTWGISRRHFGVEITEFDMGNRQTLDLVTLASEPTGLMLGRHVLGFRSILV
ncbi:hypothetical protein HYT74_02415 [Candidatus Daviesbacteria bacterium]|nr:hypothetical protein [Candidatus Daviesbacteria bacterium]